MVARSRAAACSVCGDWVCDEHAVECGLCGALECGAHRAQCALCAAPLCARCAESARLCGVCLALAEAEPVAPDAVGALSGLPPWLSPSVAARRWWRVARHGRSVWFGLHRNRVVLLAVNGEGQVTAVKAMSLPEMQLLWRQR